MDDDGEYINKEAEECADCMDVAWYVAPKTSRNYFDKWVQKVMPAWINKPFRDTSVYDFEIMKLPWVGMAQEPIAKSYRCKKTGKIVTSEALPRCEGKKIFVKLANEWKEDRTEEAVMLIMISKLMNE